MKPRAKQTARVVDYVKKNPGKSPREIHAVIGDVFGCDLPYVQNVMRKYGLYVKEKTKAYRLAKLIEKGERDSITLAKVVGCHPATARVALDKAGFSGADRDSFRTVAMPLPVIRALKYEARMRGKTDWRALAKELLTIIAEENMFDAVLDE